MSIDRVFEERCDADSHERTLAPTADHEDFVHREGGTALVLQYGAALSTHALVMEGVIFTLHVLVKQSGLCQ